MTSMILVEGRFSDESVNASLRAKVSVSPQTLDRQGCFSNAALYTALTHAQYVDSKVLLLSPVNVHLKEHFRPVLTVLSSCSGTYCQDRVVPVMGAGQHLYEFEPVQSAVNSGKTGYAFIQKVFIASVFKQLNSDIQILKPAFNFSDGIQPRKNFLVVTNILHGFFSIVPETGLCHYFVKFSFSFRKQRKVKDPP